MLISNTRMTFLASGDFASHLADLMTVVIQ